jgi:DDE superfamily endonuclease
LPRNVKKTVKHGGGSLQVWGCLTWDGAGRLHRVDGHMNAIQYCDILKESLFGTLKDYCTDSSDIILVQDNDPKHTSKLATKWFEDHYIKILDWAPSSPDMNIIEHFWDELDRCLCARTPLPHNLDKLWDALVEEWVKLDISYVQNLYESMLRCVAALLKGQGQYTKY